MTQSIQVLDQRTQRELQYVEKMEVQLRGLQTKFQQVEENHMQNVAKQYKVSKWLGRSGTSSHPLGPNPPCSSHAYQKDNLHAFPRKRNSAFPNGA